MTSFGATVFWPEWTEISRAAGPDSTYQSAAVQNRPPASGLVVIAADPTVHTLTFSRPIVNPVLAWTSVNGPGIQFNNPIVIGSSGCGYWGCGDLSDVGGNVMRSNGEGHGVMYFTGTFGSISFTSEGAENWRGFTLAANEIAEPASLGLLSGGLAAALIRRC